MPSFFSLKREAHWLHPSKLPKKVALNKVLRLWLLDKASLTAKLIQLSQGEFRVRVLRQVHGRASLSEALALKIAPHSLCLIREVVLMGQYQPWVFARSVLPLSSLVGRLRHLRKQNNRPLGAFLFSQSRLTRSPIALSLISRHHAYVPAEFMRDEPLWGRRSIFHIDDKVLLVSEVFLPDFPHVF